MSSKIIIPPITADDLKTEMDALRMIAPSFSEDELGRHARKHLVVKRRTRVANALKWLEQGVNTAHEGDDLLYHPRKKRTLNDTRDYYRRTDGLTYLTPLCQ